MEVMQISVSTFESGMLCATLQCGKKAAYFSHCPSWFNICMQNASHNAWHGAGKHFDGFDDAKRSYKSKEMQAMIEYFESLLALYNQPIDEMVEVQ